MFNGLSATCRAAPRRTRCGRSGSRWLARAASAWLAGWLAGCASVPPPGPEPIAADVPLEWSAPDAAPLERAVSLEQWWLSFGDPTLARLVGQALQANPGLAAAQAALREARAQRDVAAAGLAPSLAGSASAQRGMAGGQSTGSAFKVGLDASWELDVFGANRSALQSSEAGARASAASLGDVQVSIAAEVALGYIGLRNAQARLAIAQQNLSSQLETLQLVQWRVQAGLATSIESEQARAASEQTRAQLPALQTAIAQGAHALAVLTGRPPAALSQELAVPAPVPSPAATLALSLPAETLRQRPDVRGAEEQVRAALARVAQADARRWPDFRLSGTLGLSALTLGALTNGASTLGSVLAGVSQPLFDGGAAAAQVRVQQAALDQARSQHRSAVLGALKDVEDALVALRGDRERLARLQQAADAAGTAALLARQRFASGLVDFQTVLETQRNQLNTQDGVASAFADVSTDHVRLYKALGGGWQPGSIKAALATGATQDPAP